MSNGEVREPELQEFVLENKHLFGDMGRTSLIFEKRLSVSKKDGAPVSIADCLIFTEKKNIIGCELKSEADNTRRLNRQLRASALICDYQYVICHDKHVPEVERIINRYGHQQVGIISYIEFRGEIVAGVYREPIKNPKRDAYHVLNMLWKSEIVSLLGAFRRPLERAEKELGVSIPENRTTYGDKNNQNSFTHRMSKPQLIRNLIARVGPEEATKIACDVFINNKHDVAKSIKLRHFYPSKLERGEDNG